LALETAIKKVIRDRLGSEDITMSAMTNKPSCRTFVVARMKDNMDAYPTLFRSYECEYYMPSTCPIWQAARATSAAPTFFEPMRIEHSGVGIGYVDGGLGSNNPSELARDEAERIWNQITSCCLVSIGTGLQSAIQFDVEKLETDVTEQRKAFECVVEFIPSLLQKVPGWRRAWSFPEGVKAVLKMAVALSSLVTNAEDVHTRLSNAA
jgi:predicted acylesterase/phospholipase RssA